MPPVSADDDEIGDRPSPMMYDGGVRIGPADDSERPFFAYNKFVIVCRGPRIAWGWKGPKCPHCGGKTALYEPAPDIREVAHEAGERAAATIWGLLTFPFRRPRVAEETEFCAHCTDEIGPVCDERGCVWDHLQAAADATEAAREAIEEAWRG